MKQNQSEALLTGRPMPMLLSHFLIPVWGIRGICFAVAAGWILLVAIEGAYSLRQMRL